MGVKIRIATWPTVTDRNENQRLVRMLMRRADLPGSSLTAVELSTYLPGGTSPVHAESHSEEIVYFRRGTGQVRVGDVYHDVKAGDAVAIPPSATHQVINTGTDSLEHVLVGANVLEPIRSAAPDRAPGHLAGLPEDGMKRLGCRRVVVGVGETSDEVLFDDMETVHAISSGFIVLEVQAVDRSFEWQFALDSSHIFWLPQGHPHHYRNVGDVPAQIVTFTNVAMPE